MNGGIVARRHVFDLGGHAAAEIGESAVGQAHTGGGADGDDGIAFHAQKGGRRTDHLEKRRQSFIVEGSDAALLDDGVYGFGRQADAGEYGGLSGIDVDTVLEPKTE